MQKIGEEVKAVFKILKKLLVKEEIPGKQIDFKLPAKK